MFICSNEFSGLISGVTKGRHLSAESLANAIKLSLVSKLSAYSQRYGKVAPLFFFLFAEMDSPATNV
jgi:hypothetical protein